MWLTFSGSLRGRAGCVHHRCRVNVGVGLPVVWQPRVRPAPASRAIRLGLLCAVAANSIPAAMQSSKALRSGQSYLKAGQRPPWAGPDDNLVTRGALLWTFVLKQSCFTATIARQYVAIKDKLQVIPRSKNRIWR